MRYRNDIELRCEYCRHGCAVGEGEIACFKRGIMTPGFHCAKFRYDATKRTPERRAVRPNAGKYSAEMFKLQ